MQSRPERALACWTWQPAPVMLSELPSSADLNPSESIFQRRCSAKARSLFPTASFVCGESDDLPFDDLSFDAVTINFGMLHFGDPDRALSEAHRVLRHGGRIGFTVWAPPSDTKTYGIVYGAIETHGTLDVPLPPGPPFFQYSDSKISKNALRKAGL